MAGGSGAPSTRRSSSKDNDVIEVPASEKRSGMLCVDFEPPQTSKPVGQEPVAGPSGMDNAQMMQMQMQSQMLQMMSAMTEQLAAQKKRKRSHDMSNSEDSQSESDDEETDEENQSPPFSRDQDEDEDPLDKLSEYFFALLKNFGSLTATHVLIRLSPQQFSCQCHS